MRLWNSSTVLTDTRLTIWSSGRVIAILAQWLTNKAQPNKSGPRGKASLGCLPLSAPLASVRESSLRRGYAWQLCDPGNALEWAERVKIGKRRMGATPVHPKRHAGRSKGYSFGSIRIRRRLVEPPVGQGKAALSTTESGGGKQFRTESVPVQSRL